MDLKQFFDETKIKKKDFANAIGISSYYLSNIISQRKIPSRSLALKIEEFTEGLVPANTLLFPKIRYELEGNVAYKKVLKKFQG